MNGLKALLFLGAIAGLFFYLHGYQTQSASPRPDSENRRIIPITTPSSPPASYGSSNGGLTTKQFNRLLRQATRSGNSGLRIGGLTQKQFNRLLRQTYGTSSGGGGYGWGTGSNTWGSSGNGWGGDTSGSSGWSPYTGTSQGGYDSAGCPKNQWVNGYFRSDGTYVNGYWRNSPTDNCDATP